VRSKGNHLEQREKLGLTSAAKGQSKLQTLPQEPTTALEKVEVCINYFMKIKLLFKALNVLGTVMIPVILSVVN